MISPIASRIASNIIDCSFHVSIGDCHKQAVFMADESIDGNNIRESFYAIV